MGLRPLFLRRKLLFSYSVFLVKTKVLQNTTTHTKSEGSGGCSTIWGGMGWSGKQERRLSTICDILGATPPWVPRSCRLAIGVSGR